MLTTKSIHIDPKTRRDSLYVNTKKIADSVGRGSPSV